MSRCARDVSGAQATLLLLKYIFHLCFFLFYLEGVFCIYNSISVQPFAGGYFIRCGLTIYEKSSESQALNALFEKIQFIYFLFSAIESWKGYNMLYYLLGLQNGHVIYTESMLILPAWNCSLCVGGLPLFRIILCAWQVWYAAFCRGIIGRMRKVIVGLVLKCF